MTLEKTLRKNVCDILRDAKLDPMAVENVCLAGCPDVECILGWIELKASDHWPADPQRVVRLDHELSNEQRIWLRRRCHKGGRAFVLIQVEKDYLLLWGATAAQYLGYATESELRRCALGHCSGLADLRIQLPQWLRLPTTTTP